MNDQNLKPFVKGDPRIGQKRKGCLHAASILKKLAKKRLIVKDDIDGVFRRMTVAEQIGLVHIAKILSGDVQALKEYYDRVDGKVAQPMEHAGAGGAPLAPAQITFVGINTDDSRVAKESPASPSVQQAL